MKQQIVKIKKGNEKRTRTENKSKRYCTVVWCRVRWIYPETHLEVLAAPDVHPFVVRAEFVEVLLVDGEEAAGHGGGAQRGGAVVVATLHLSLGYSVPSEVQLPVESTPGHVRRRYVLERFVRDDVDDGTDDRLPVLDDPGEERFEPTFRALAVGVQERDDLALDVLRPQETRPDQTGALLRSQDHHRNGQRLDVLLQLAAQVFSLAGVVYENDLLEQGPGRPIDHTPHGSEKRRPGLIVENNNDRRRRKHLWIFLIFATLEPDVGQRPIQRNHVAGQEVELVELELFFHEGLLVWGDVHSFAHLSGNSVRRDDRRRGAPPPQLALFVRGLHPIAVMTD
jgi:hypothetical protein